MLKINLLPLLFIVFFANSYCQSRLPGAASVSEQEFQVNFAKEAQLKKDIEDVGLAVANSLMRCCSSYGGNHVYAMVEYEKVRQNTLTGAFTIPVKVGWYGSLSGTHYWIYGKLMVNADGSKSWLKISDSGGFSGGCSIGCIN